MTSKLIWITPNASEVMGYCARVSNPANQENKEVLGLLKYCAKHGHWSVFEMASMCVEITTSRAISAQILRHKSFSFQEFSQRYAEKTEIVRCSARRQDTKNRQNSLDDLPQETRAWFHWKQKELGRDCVDAYNYALELGVAKECARMLLPLATETKLYMSGSIRSWVHYIQLRTHESTQLEHREVAESVKSILIDEIPLLLEVL